MATYIQNVQDKVTQVRPPQTNWQMEAQLLSTRQGAYDQGHDKLSQMYGQILNAGLTREGNIEAREEFFKLIDSDLRKVAGIDLSKDRNVTQAKNVFNQIYSNDYLVKDMVWTKNFQSEMERAQAFKNCTDPAECGGQYWDDGVKHMQYKREEFKNSTNDESLQADNARYIPYNNLMAQAMKDMKEAGLDITVEPTPDGSRYRAKMRNGDLLVNPLIDLFNGLYANNPQFQDMYKVMAYNERKDWTYNAVQSGEYATLDEAALGFVERQSAAIEKDFDRIAHGIKYDTDALQEKYDAYLDDIEKGRFNKEDVKDFQKTEQLLAGAQQVDGYLDIVRNAKKNMHSQSSMANIGDYLDAVRATNLFNGEMATAAETFANKNKEITYTEDKFALADQQHAFDVDMENREFQHKMAMEQWKHDHGSTAYGADKTNFDKMAEKMMVAEKAMEDVDALDITNSFIEGMANIDGYDPKTVKGGLVSGMTPKQLQRWIDNYSAGNANQVKPAAQQLLDDLNAEDHKNRVTANIRNLQAIQAGNDPATLKSKVDWSVMTPEDMTGIAMGFPELWQEIPMKAALEGTAFAEGGKKGRLYQGKQTGMSYVRDGNGEWWKLKQGAEWNDQKNWYTGPEVQTQAWDAWNGHQLDRTQY